MPGMIDFIPNLPCIMDLDICMITGTVLMSSVVTKAVLGSIVKKSAVEGFFLFAWSCVRDVWQVVHFFCLHLLFDAC